MEFKTLKDLDLSGEIKQTLRKEVIKWIKSMRESNGLGCPVEINRKGKGGCPAGDCQSCGGIYLLLDFFNISEEERKRED